MKYRLANNNRLLLTEVKQFGNKGAHVTVPYDWKDQQVFVMLASDVEVDRFESET